MGSLGWNFYISGVTTRRFFAMPSLAACAKTVTSKRATLFAISVARSGGNVSGVSNVSTESTTLLNDSFSRRGVVGRQLTFRLDGAEYPSSGEVGHMRRMALHLAA